MQTKIEIETEMRSVVIVQGLQDVIEIEDVLDLATVIRDAQDHQEVTETGKIEIIEEIRIVIATEIKIKTKTETEDIEMTTNLDLERKIEETVVVKAPLRDVEEAKTSASAWFE